jgi:hypothetical protein
LARLGSAPGSIAKVFSQAETDGAIATHHQIVAPGKSRLFPG